MLAHQLAQPAEEVLPHRRGVRDQPAFEQLDRRRRGGAGDGVAAERAGVRARRPVHHVGLAAVTPSGRPDAMPLAIDDDVRLQAEVLRGEHLPGPAHARLHFVDDQQDAVLRRQLAQPLVELDRRHDVAAFALDRLDDDRRDLVRRHEVHEQPILDPGDRLGGDLRRRHAGGGAIRRPGTARGRRPASSPARSPCAARRGSTSAPSEPSVRPWNEPRNAIRNGRLVW